MKYFDYRHIYEQTKTFCEETRIALMQLYFRDVFRSTETDEI